MAWPKVSGQSWSSERCRVSAMCRTLTLLTQSLSDCLRRVLDDWPTSRTKYFSWNRNFLSMPSTSTLELQSEDNTVRNGSGSSAQIPSHLMPCADSDIIHVSALGTSIYLQVKLLQSRLRPSRPEIQYLLQQVSMLVLFS